MLDAQWGKFSQRACRYIFRRTANAAGRTMRDGKGRGVASDICADGRKKTRRGIVGEAGKQRKPFARDYVDVGGLGPDSKHGCVLG